MTCSAQPTTLDSILPFRDEYRREMDCQIIHDSIHTRPGWSHEYLLLQNDIPVGHGSLALAGPWKDKPTLYEFHVTPAHRSRAFDFFTILLETTRAVAIETQSNDPQLTVMLHTFARDVICEAILFHEKLTTTYPAPEGVTFRRATPDDAAQIAAQKLDDGADYVLESPDGTIAATGGILFHYNRPYGDLYMAVAEQFRRRGLGAYMIQELKRTAHENGHIPAARCNVHNIASRKTLQKSGFVPCGNIIVGSVDSPSVKPSELPD
jgi:GNAT superfamily N-acetyltransferase